MRSRSLSVLLSVLLCLGVAGAAPAASETPSLIRDHRTITVRGARETWRLVWSAPPKAVCPAEEVVVSMTCPCSGWAYGEGGDLVLVRSRDGREVDRFRLAPLFGKFDGPGDAGPNDAYVQRWPEDGSDLDRQDRGDAKLLAEIRGRPTPSIILPADYNHDGQATEFLVQVGTLPCGKRQYAAVGVTKTRPTLHALGSKAHPDEPLTMPLHAWRALLRSPRPTPVLIWPCDDHGSEVRSMLTVSAQGGVIRAVNADYGCPSQGNTDRLVKTTEW